MTKWSTQADTDAMDDRTLDHFQREQTARGAICWSVISACKAARKSANSTDPLPEVEAVLLLAQDELCRVLRSSFATVQKYRNEFLAELTVRERAARLDLDAAAGALWLEQASLWIAMRLQPTRCAPPRVVYRAARLLGMSRGSVRDAFAHDRLLWLIVRVEAKLQCRPSALERRRLCAALALLRMLSNLATAGAGARRRIS